MVEDSCICNCATSYISATVLRYTFLFYAKGYDKLKIAMDHVTPRVKILHPLFFKITLTQCNYSDYSCGYIRSIKTVLGYFCSITTNSSLMDANGLSIWCNTFQCPFVKWHIFMFVKMLNLILGNDFAQNLICRKTQRAMTEMIY